MAAKRATSGVLSPLESPGLGSWETSARRLTPPSAGGPGWADGSRGAPACPEDHQACFCTSPLQQETRLMLLRQGPEGSRAWAAVGSGPWTEKGQPSLSGLASMWGSPAVPQAPPRRPPKVSTISPDSAPGAEAALSSDTIPTFPFQGGPSATVQPQGSISAGQGGRRTGRRKAHPTQAAAWHPQVPPLAEVALLLAPAAGPRSPRVRRPGRVGRRPWTCWKSGRPAAPAAVVVAAG